MSLLPLAILLSLAVGATVGAQLVKASLQGWIIFGIGAVVLFAGFYLLSLGHDPALLDARGVTELTGLGWFGLCTVLFALSMGIGACVKATVKNWPKPRLRGRRR